MNIRETIQQTHQTLEAVGLPDARLEAEVMVMTVMRMARQNIFAEQETEVGAQQARDLADIVDQRLERVPLAYILGYREFYGINVMVTPSVLIPRPETEGIVEHTLFMALMGMETRELVIADVGTGSGAIAVNLAIHLPAARIYAVDVSEPALDVAAYNIRAHGVADRVRLGHGDLLEAVPEPVDLIVANLPYIPSARLPELAPEVRERTADRAGRRPGRAGPRAAATIASPREAEAAGRYPAGTRPGAVSRRRRGRPPIPAGGGDLGRARPQPPRPDTGSEPALKTFVPSPPGLWGRRGGRCPTGSCACSRWTPWAGPSCPAWP